MLGLGFSLIYSDESSFKARTPSPSPRIHLPFSRFTLWKYRSRCLAAADNLFSLCLFFLWTGGRRRNNKNYEFDKLFLKAIEDETKFYKFKSLWQSNLDSPKVHTINHPWNSYHLLVNMQIPQRWNGGLLGKLMCSKHRFQFQCLDTLESTNSTRHVWWMVRFSWGRGDPKNETPCVTC